MIGRAGNFPANYFSVRCNMAQKKQAVTGKLPYDQFFIKAILALRTDGYEGCHSGKINRAFRAYYPGIEPVPVSKALEAKGVIHVWPCKGGVMVYAGPSTKQEKGPAVDPGMADLAKMGL